MKFGLFMCMFLLSSATHAMTCISEENASKKLVIEKFGVHAVGKIFPEPSGNGGSVMAGQKHFEIWSADGSSKMGYYTFYNQDGELVKFHYSSGPGGCRARACDATGFNTITGKLSVDGGDHEYFDCY